MEISNLQFNESGNEAFAKHKHESFIHEHPPEKCGVFPSLFCTTKSYEKVKRENVLQNESLSRRAHALMFDMTSTKTEEERELSAMHQSKLLELTSVVGYLKELKAKSRYIEVAELCISELQLLKLKDLRHDYVDRLHDISSRWKKGKDDYHTELKKIWG